MYLHRSRFTALLLFVFWFCGVQQVTAVVVTGLDGNTPENRLTQPGTSVTGIDHDGVGDLIVQAIDGSGSRSTASLLWTGRHLLTAAHSVTNENGGLDVSSTGDSFITFEMIGATTTLGFRSAQVSVHPGWNGNVLDGFDLAIIDLGAAVDSSLPRYDIYTGGPDPLLDASHTFFGYGLSGTGDTGSILPSGEKRWGQNQYDGFTGTGILLYDFDDGSAERDAMAATFGPDFADLGLGAVESGAAPGDSGGPHFIEDPDLPGTFQIAGITSFGLSASTDIDTVTNSTYGELIGDANVSALSDWIVVTVPEVSGHLLVLLTGLTFGCINVVRRDRG